MWNMLWGAMPSAERGLLLASGSPRRRDMIRDLGLKFEARGLDVDESVQAGESAPDYVRRVTLQKVSAGADLVRDQGLIVDGVLAADTVVVLENAILGKPGNRREASRMIRALSGCTHQVMTSYALFRLTDSRMLQRTVSTDVSFREASSEEVEGYVATGEGDDKAGAYAIQGVGAFLVSRISGSYSNVVGLPLCELVQDLKELGFLRAYP